MRTFDPWVGKHYSEGLEGIKLMILGEAHYQKKEEMRSTFTIDVIRKHGQQSRFRFFSVIQRLIIGNRGIIDIDNRKEFWERVAFCNYIQEFPSDTPRCCPTQAMWDLAREPFLQTLQEHTPHILLVLGSRLKTNLPELPKDLDISECVVNHPSSRGFRYDKWQPIVKSAFNTVKLQRSGNQPS